MNHIFKYIKVLTLIFFILFIQYNAFGQTLTISGSGSTTPDSSWSITGSNPVEISASANASINVSLIQDYLNDNKSVIISISGQSTSDDQSDSGDINYNGQLTKSLTNQEVTLTFKASNRVNLDSNSTLKSTNGKLNIILWSDSDNNEKGGVYLNNSVIETNGGNFTAGGGSNPLTDFAVGYGYPGINIPPIYQYDPQRYGFRMDGGSISAQGGDINIRGNTVSGETGSGVYIGRNYYSEIQTNSTGNVYIESNSSAGAYYGLVIDKGSKIDGGEVWLNGKSSTRFALNINDSQIGTQNATKITLETNFSGSNGWSSSMWLGKSSGDAIIGNTNNTLEVNLVPTKQSGSGRGMISGYGFQLNGKDEAILKIYPGDSNSLPFRIGAQSVSSSHWDLIDYSDATFLMLSTELNNNMTGFKQIIIGREDQNVDYSIENFTSTISRPVLVKFNNSRSGTNNSSFLQGGVGYLNYTSVRTHQAATSNYDQYADSEAELDAMFDTNDPATTLLTQGYVLSNSSEGLNGGVPWSGSYDYVGASYDGWFYATRTGTYSFAITSDDASDLSLNEAVIVSYYGGHGSGTYEYGNIDLQAGQWYKFNSRYTDYEAGNVLVAKVKQPNESVYSVIGSQVTSDNPSSIQDLLAQR